MTPTVLANDFARQWADTREDSLSAVDRVGASGWLILGREVEEFESEIAAWWGISNAVGVASGLDAIEIALRCAGVGGGDRVLTTPLTAFATTLAILRAGAVPVWCDVDESGSMDLEQADHVLSEHEDIRAVVPVHLYGHPLDPHGLKRLIEDHSVIVIEDCAQSAGAHKQGSPTGSVGLAAATSFYPTKNLGAMGDGGLILTDDAEIAERAREMRNYGQRRRYEHVSFGVNSRLDEVHAAILRSAHLPRLDGWLQRRRDVADRYNAGLSGTALRPIAPTGGRSAHHLYPVEVLDGDPARLIDALGRAGVAGGRHYPLLACDQEAVADVGQRIGQLPVAHRLAKNEVSLPIHPYISDEEIDHVLRACRDACP